MNISATTGSRILGLTCSACQQPYSHTVLQSFSACCGKPLTAVYDTRSLDRHQFRHRPDTMWRYKEMLPVLDEKNIFSLHEGGTPIHHLSTLGALIGIEHLHIKDESFNPTCSFKARGLSMGVSKGKELGVKGFIIPTAGNAGGALSAYCAKAKIPATVVMPKHTAKPLQEECRLLGARVILSEGLIDQCGKFAKQLATTESLFDISTMKEPYRLEGKKTLGYEIAAYYQWTLPDMIIYPAGGGTGLIGMWKAFKEMQALGWIDCPLPRMILIQSTNCAPMSYLFNEGSLPATYDPQPSQAYGLAVPHPFAADMMLDVLRESDGTVVTVTEAEMNEHISSIAAQEGLLLCPEGAATYAGLLKLIQQGNMRNESSVLLFNTGSWFKYFED